MKEIRPQPERKSLPGAWVYWGLAVVTLGVLALCAYFDLSIARATYEPDSRFGQFLREFGEYPGHSLLLFSAGVYLLYGRHLVIRLLMVLLFCLEVFIFIQKHHPAGSFIEGVVVYSLILFPFIVIVNARRYMTKAAMARNSGLVVLAGVLHPLFLVQVVKKLWGRVRFNDLEDGFAQFTPWYLPQGITDNHSFPSGHTAMGIIACFLVLYVPRRWRVVAFIPLFVWALAVAASRVVLGAHYASDVVFSLSAGLGLLFFFHRISADESGLRED